MAKIDNTIIKGDNLSIMREIDDESIDLIYLDPPFNTGKDWGAFDDRWDGGLKGYLKFMEERCVEMHRLLKDTGSFYLHCDSNAIHYIKVMLDRIFGMSNFRNEITRIKCNPKNFERIGYGNIKDMILFYSKSSEPIWNEPIESYTKEDLEQLYPNITQGKRYTTVPIHAPGETVHGKSNQTFKGLFPPNGRHWRTDVKTLEQWDEEGLIEWSSTGNPRKIIFADDQEGKRVQDIWEYKDPQYPMYPTEKNPNLLYRIIKTSSNPESMVLDPFCGSGTTLIAADRLQRSWMGIDISSEACEIAYNRVKEEQGMFCNVKIQNNDG